MKPHELIFKQHTVSILLSLVIAIIAQLPEVKADQAEKPLMQDDDKSTIKPWDQIELSTLWYLSYGFGENQAAPFNKEHIGRGYVTLKFTPFKWFQPRVTLDTHQDDTGDWKVRLKYMYAKFALPGENTWITEPNLEFGLVHGPWFDFEEHINNYRMQGTMFIERNGVLNSADAGITFGGLLGKKLPKDYQKKVSSKYPGTYGSFALGIYNGGGYHAKETNQNKVVASRLSIRPLGLMLPGLQLSHFFISGKGNTADQPDWLLNALMASYEHEYLVITAQYAIGKGNQKGTQVVADKATELQGASGFAEIKLPWIRSSLIGRVDWFEWDDAASTRIIAGYAFYIYKKNFVLLDIDRVMYDESGKPDDWQAKITLQVAVL